MEANAREDGAFVVVIRSPLGDRLYSSFDDKSDANELAAQMGKGYEVEAHYAPGTRWLNVADQATVANLEATAQAAEAARLQAEIDAKLEAAADQVAAAQVLATELSKVALTVKS